MLALPYTIGLNKTFGLPLWTRLTQSWGNKSLGQDANTTHPYAIAVTEFGSQCNIADSSCADTNYLVDFASYLSYNPSSGPFQGNPSLSHARVQAWFWWCWNANSGDTGGLVVSNRTSPWYVLQFHKLYYLQITLGLKPWWAASP